MSGSIHNVTGQQLRRYVRHHLTNYLVITRKATNPHAVLFDGRTGMEALKMTSNFAMLEWLRAHPQGPGNPRNPGLGLSANPTEIRTRMAKQIGQQALDLLLEAEEWLGQGLYVTQIAGEPRMIIRTETEETLTTAERYEHE